MYLKNDLIYIHLTTAIMSNQTMAIKVIHFQNGHRIPDEFMIPYPDEGLLTPADFHYKLDPQLMTPDDFIMNQSYKTIEITTILSLISFIILLVLHSM